MLAGKAATVGREGGKRLIGSTSRFLATEVALGRTVERRIHVASRSTKKDQQGRFLDPPCWLISRAALPLSQTLT